MPSITDWFARTGVTAISAPFPQNYVNKPVVGFLVSRDEMEIGMDVNLESLNKMMAVWNTPDAEAKRALAEAALEHNVHFVDPNHNIIGRTAFLEMVDLVQSQIPGAIYSRASQVEAQNNHCRYHWAIHLNDELIMPGFDVTEINDAGRIVKVIGFFGELAR